MNSLNKYLKSKLNLVLGSIFLVGLIAPMLLISQSAKAAACSMPSPSYGTDSVPVSVPSTSTYTIWTRMLSPSASSNQVLLQVDNTSCYTLGGSKVPANTWTWVSYQTNGSTVSLSLSQGNNTLEYLGNQSGVEIDRVELISGNSCTPSGTGTNCPGTTTTTTPPASTTPPATGSSGSSSTSSSKTSSTPRAASTTPTTQVVSGTGPVTAAVVQGNVLQSGSAPLTLEPNVTDTQQISKVQYYLNNKLVYTATKSPYTYKVNTGNLTNGNYKLTAKTFYQSGNTVTQTETLIVKHNFWRDSWLILKKYSPIIFIAIVLVAAFAIWRRYYLSTPGSPGASGVEINLPPEAPTEPTSPAEPAAPADQPPASEPPNPETDTNRSKFPWR